LASVDRQLVLAFVVPLLIWPWVPGWDSDSLRDGQFTYLALFLLTPVVEEVVFRGFLQGWLLNKVWYRKQTGGISRANWFTSLFFACAHLWQHALMLVPGYFLVSLLLGHFRERYHGILVPVLLHGYYNLGLLFLAK
jgi:uncharacterized protein